MTPLVVAVDGPGGAGKSTISRRVAERLGWAHLDTGAYYRAASLAVLEAGADPADPVEVLAAVDGRRFAQVGSRMLLDGVDVSIGIRDERVDQAVSAVSAHPELRRRMVALQREWVAAHPEGAVVEGRDIGTVVLTDAPVKVFLTADPVERARRRAAETGGEEGEVAVALDRRDRFDSGREASPLRPAEDASVIDTTSLEIEEVVELVVELARRAGLTR